MLPKCEDYLDLKLNCLRDLMPSKALETLSARMNSGQEKRWTNKKVELDLLLEYFLNRNGEMLCRTFVRSFARVPLESFMEYLDKELGIKNPNRNLSKRLKSYILWGMDYAVGNLKSNDKSKGLEKGVEEKGVKGIANLDITPVPSDFIYTRGWFT